MFSHLKGTTLESSFQIKLDSSTLAAPGESVFECRAAGPWLLGFSTWLEQMISSRELNKDFYFSRFPPSIESLSSYLLNGPINNPNQILLLIIDNTKKLHGHLGFKVDNSGNVEFDNLLRTSNDYPGIIRLAVEEILSWSTEELSFSEYVLKVISTNQRAIDLYKELGFIIQETISLKIEHLPNGVTNLVPSKNEISDCVEEMLIMKRKF